MTSSFITPRRRSQIHYRQLELGRKHRPDYWLLILCASLLAIGLIVVYAISPALSQANHVSSGYYIGKQVVAIGLSLLAFIITARVPLSWWQRAYKPLLVAAAIATLFALIIPVNPAFPAHRWVRLGSFSFQSVELLKFAILIWLAGFLAARIKQGTIHSRVLTLKPLVIALLVVSAVVVGIQSDLGSAGVIVAIMGTMAYIAGLPLGRIMLIAMTVILIALLAVSITPYRRDRLQSYLHPGSHCQSSGYQACQALIAVGSGGVIGLGLGSGVQAYGYLPEAANDSIFAIYAEKFGFIGGIVLLAVFMAFFTRLKSIAERLPDDFSRLLVVGVLAWLSVQTVINIGAMIGLLPLKGITLPFISYGGTSVVFVAAAVGLVFQASQYASYTVPRVASGVGQRDVYTNPARRTNY
ncbi:MAG TPA: putative peptidoglycan glycosyltransferase FtsW [Candidatus Saccharimonadales bacterium]|nr:putative peptidoglycan glycosyltransferase FtsW [Candidatus Saccharimonadales bacterium]